MDDDNESFEAHEAQNRELGQELEEEEDEEDDEEEDEEEDDDDDDEEDEEEEEEDEGFSELQSSVAPVGAEFMESSQSQTLAVSSSIPFSETDQHADLAASSSQQLLTGKVVNSASQMIDSGKFKKQIGAFNQEVLRGVTVQAAAPQTENQLRFPTSSSELSPTSVTQSTISASSPTMFEPRLSPSPKGNNGCVSETDHQNSSDRKGLTTVPIVKTPSADGYNWRKYGQKLVKSTKGSRSYYKCTYSDCCSKKIECSDHSGTVIEIIYKGAHNHEPPRKVNSTKESRLAASTGSNVGNSLITHPVKILNDPDPSLSSRKPIQETSPLPERKRQKSSDSDGKVEVKVKDEKVVEPEPKQRLKKSGTAYPAPVLKPGKKPKLVVHAAGDVGISSDGYRWRKYGQKMVKGNPHPRNYYRCTSAGCPVRKHIERAIENTTALIITYKGVHDHDMPVPKKRHGPPSAHLVAAAAPASMSNLQLKSCDTLQNQISSTQWSLGTEGELTGEALDLGGEKAMESARTLLSIGFEIKPC